MSTRIVVLVVAITLGVSQAGFGQETTGTVSGRVVDSQGLPIPGATVTVTGAQGTKQTVTDGTGNRSSLDRSETPRRSTSSRKCR